ncbi:MAG: oligosaccharide flippase family protein [Lachnospiraceae bacterium]|nr:oligosaccharide flippase family protein [Candidatus Colinaster equi]
MLKKLRELIEAQADYIWNYISVVILAACGFALNVIIAYAYGEEVLGTFNQAYAWYTVISQIAVLGIHNAVTKYVAEYIDEKELVGNYYSVSVISVTVISIVITVLTELVIYALNNKGMISNPLAISMLLIMLGLPFFSINKVILGYINGISEFKAYAIYQSLRYILLLVMLGIIIICDWGGEYTALVFPIEEMVLLLVMLIKYSVPLKYDREVNKNVLTFGVKSLPSNMVSQITPKVDILSLSLMQIDAGLIGVYSLVTSFSDGFYQLYIVLRKKVNPSLSYNYSKNIGYNEGKDWKSIKMYVYALLPIGGACVIAVYIFLCKFILGDAYSGGIPSICILIICAILNGKWIAYGNMFSQYGYPSIESIINVVTLLVNVLFNIALIWKIGVIGAAIATGISYFAYSILMSVTYRKRFANKRGTK